MSKGPPSSLRLFHTFSRSTEVLLTSSSDRSTWTRRNPSFFSFFSDCRNCRQCWPMTWSPKSRSAPRLVALTAHLFGQAEDDGDGKYVKLFGELDQRFSGKGLDVGGIDDGELQRPEAFGGHIVKGIEGVVGCGEVVLVITDQSSKKVRGEYFGRREVLSGEGGLT